MQQTRIQDTDRLRFKSPRKLLAFYIFVQPEVFVVEETSPHKTAPFQLRYSRRHEQHFYLCYSGGVKPSTLDQWLADCIVS